MLVSNPGFDGDRIWVADERARASHVWMIDTPKDRVVLLRVQ